jgi:hypothetical protein
LCQKQDEVIHGSKKAKSFCCDEETAKSVQRGCFSLQANRTDGKEVSKLHEERTEEKIVTNRDVEERKVTQ